VCGDLYKFIVTLVISFICKETGMKILQLVKKVPGGLMVVPLLLGVFLNTFVPGVLNIGGFTTNLWKTGASTLIAMFLFCNGAQINVKQAGQPVLKGVLLTFVKFLIGAVLGVLSSAPKRLRRRYHLALAVRCRYPVVPLRPSAPAGNRSI
jgi:hypothetical protein